MGVWMLILIVFYNEHGSGHRWLPVMSLLSVSIGKENLIKQYNILKVNLKPSKWEMLYSKHENENPCMIDVLIHVYSS